MGRKKRKDKEEVIAQSCIEVVNRTQEQIVQGSYSRISEESHGLLNFEMNEANASTSSNESSIQNTNMQSKKQRRVNNLLRYIRFIRWFSVMISVIGSIVTIGDISINYFNGSNYLDLNSINQTLNGFNETESSYQNFNFTTPLYREFNLTNGIESNSSSIGWSDFYLSAVAPINSKIMFGLTTVASLSQATWMLCSIGELNYAIFDYLKKNFNSNTLKALCKISIAKEPKDAIEAIENDFAKYVLYQNLKNNIGEDAEVSNSDIYKAGYELIEKLNDSLKNLLNDEKNIDDQYKKKFLGRFRNALRKRVEINILMLRFFQNTEYNRFKRLKGITENSIKMLSDEIRKPNNINSQELEEFTLTYVENLKKVLDYSSKKELFHSLLMQNLGFFAQFFDIMATSYGTVGRLFSDLRAFYIVHTGLAFGQNFFSFLYSHELSCQNDHGIKTSNCLRLLNIGDNDSMVNSLTKIMNPSLSIKNMRKEQSYFSSSVWNFLAMGSHIIAFSFGVTTDRLPETVIIRSPALITSSTLLGRSEIALALLNGKSDLNELSWTLALNTLMPQNLIYGVAEMLKKSGANEILVLSTESLAVSSSIANVYFNVKSQELTIREAFDGFDKYKERGYKIHFENSIEMSTIASSIV